MMYVALTTWTSVSICDGMLEWELFVKPIHSGVHLSPVSLHPLSCKRAGATNQFQQAVQYSTTMEGRKKSEEKIGELLRLNDYPPEEI